MIGALFATGATTFVVPFGPSTYSVSSINVAVGAALYGAGRPSIYTLSSSLPWPTHVQMSRDIDHRTALIGLVRILTVFGLALLCVSLLLIVLVETGVIHHTSPPPAAITALVEGSPVSIGRRSRLDPPAVFEYLL